MTMTRLGMLRAIEEMLQDDNLFESGEWRDEDVVGRVAFLLSEVQGKTSEAEYWHSLLLARIENG